MRMNPTFLKKKAEAEAAAAAAAQAAGEAGEEADEETSSTTTSSSSTTPKTKRVTFHPELARRICKCVARGESIHRIAKYPGMPHPNTIFAWTLDRPEFRAQYFLAKELAKDFLEDDMIDLADDTSKDIVALKNEKGESREVLNSVAVQRSKTRIAARQWILTRLRPKKSEDAAGETSEAPAPNAPGGHVMTEERRLELIARRRAAMEAGMRAVEKAGPTTPPPSS
jgi:hypothetical protein